MKKEYIRIFINVVIVIIGIAMIREHLGGQFFNLGYAEEISYWRNLGGTGTTCTDVMVSYLSSQGYTGTPYDMFSGWIQSQKAVTGGVPWDAARALAGYK